MASPLHGILSVKPLLIVCIALAFLFPEAEDATVTYNIRFKDGANVGEINTAILKDKETGQEYEGVIYPDLGKAVFNVSTPVIDIPFEDGFNVGDIYPNPASDGYEKIPFSVSALSDIFVQVIDNNGKLVGETMYSDVNPGNYSISADFNRLASGLYHFRLSDGRSAKQGSVVIADGKGNGMVNFEPELSGSARAVGTLKTKSAKAESAGVEYSVTIQGPNFEGVYEDITVSDDTTIDRYVNDRVYGGSIEIYGIEGDTLSADLSSLFSSPTGPLSFEVYDNANDLVSALEGDDLKLSGIDDYVNGLLSGDSVLIRATHGGELVVPVSGFFDPRADLVIDTEDAYFHTPESDVGILVDGQKKGKSNAQGKYRIQLAPGNYILKTDTTGRGGQATEVEIQSLEYEDVNVKLPVGQLSEDDIRLMIDVKGGYDKNSDRKTYTRNNFWPIPEHEGLPKGTYKVVYVNLESAGVLGDTAAYNNLEHAIEANNWLLGEDRNLQGIEEGLHVEAEVGSEGDEAAIVQAFQKGELYQGHDMLIFLSRYSPNLNVCNANLGPPTKGVAIIRMPGLAITSIAARSEIGTMSTATGDNRDATDEHADGTIYGPVLSLPDYGYKNQTFYKGVHLPREKIITEVSQAFPFNTRIELKRFVMPPIKVSYEK